MATFNLTADDSSPLIIYSAGGWSDSPSDPLLDEFVAGSFHTTTTPGATASLSFVGTGIYFFGSRRPTYGDFSITIDDNTTTGSANAPTATLDVLASFPNLPMGTHTVKLTNTDKGMDLDQILLQTEVQRTGTTFSVSALDDTDPSISYLPNTQAWSVNNGSQFLNETLHYSQTPGAKISLEFAGEAIALFGTTSSDHANYSVSIDNGPASTFLAQATKQHDETLTYFTAGLTPGKHTLVLEALPPSNGASQGFIDLDQVTAFGANSTSANAGSTTADKSSAAGSRSLQHNKTLLIGIIVGSVLGFIILLVLAYMLWRVCGRRKEHSLGERGLIRPSKRSLGRSLGSSLVPRRPPALKKRRDSHDLPLQAPPAHEYHPPPLENGLPTRSSFESQMTDRSTAPLVRPPARGGLFPAQPAREGRGSPYGSDRSAPMEGSSGYRDPSDRV